MNSVISGFVFTYSSHCADAFNSVHLIRKLCISAPKFPVLQLFIAKFLQINAVDSSSNLASELENKD